MVCGTLVGIIIALVIALGILSAFKAFCHQDKLSCHTKVQQLEINMNQQAKEIDTMTEKLATKIKILEECHIELNIINVQLKETKSKLNDTIFILQDIKLSLEHCTFENVAYKEHIANIEKENDRLMQNLTAVFQLNQHLNEENALIQQRLYVCSSARDADRMKLSEKEAEILSLRNKQSLLTGKLNTFIKFYNETTIQLKLCQWDKELLCNLTQAQTSNTADIAMHNRLHLAASNVIQQCPTVFNSAVKERITTHVIPAFLSTFIVTYRWQF